MLPVSPPSICRNVFYKNNLPKVKVLSQLNYILKNQFGTKDVVGLVDINNTKQVDKKEMAGEEEQITAQSANRSIKR